MLSQLLNKDVGIIIQKNADYITSYSFHTNSKSSHVNCIVGYSIPRLHYPCDAVGN